MVLPKGIIKLETGFEAPSFCTLCRFVERAAALDVLVNAISKGEAIPLKNLRRSDTFEKFSDFQTSETDTWDIA